MSAQNHAALRRAHVDLLYVTGQLPGIEQLFAGRAEEFEPIPLDDREAVARRVESAHEILANADTVGDAMGFVENRTPEEGTSAPPLSPSDWLRAFAAVTHHRSALNPGRDFTLDDDLLDFGLRSAAPVEEPGHDTVRRALELLGAKIVSTGTPDVSLALRSMDESQRAEFEAHVGRGNVHWFQQCEIAPIPQPRGESAVRITAEYWPERSVQDFVYPADPLHWPKCNSFFKSMRPVSPQKELDQPNINDADHTGYASRLEEIVDFGYMTVKTNLDVVHYVNPDPNNPHATGMTYQWAEGGDGYIDVDHGHLTVDVVNGRTRVRSSKTLRFTELAGLRGDAAMTGGFWACQLGWLDSMKQMNRCSSP